MNSLPLKHLFTTGAVIILLATGSPAAASPGMTAPSAAPTAASITAAAAPQAPTVPKPKVKGKVQVGQTIKAVPGSWPRGTTLTYQWHGNGAPLPGETGPTLNVYWPHLAMVLTVAVTAATPGAAPITTTSAKTPAVAQNYRVPKTAKKRKNLAFVILTTGNDDLRSAHAWLRQGLYTDVPWNTQMFASDLAMLHNLGGPPNLGKKARQTFLANCLELGALAMTTSDQVAAGRYATAKKNMAKLVKRFQSDIIKPANKGYGLSYRYW